MGEARQLKAPKLTLLEQDRLFVAIGRVVVNFQQMELWLAEALTSVLELHVLEDRHLVSSSMSFRQKVDLLAVLYERKKVRCPSANIELVKKALYAAEEFRNRVVHSLWAVDQGEWVQIKASLRSKSGFDLMTNSVDITQLEAAAAALVIIKEWEIRDESMLRGALDKLKPGYIDLKLG